MTRDAWDAVEIRERRDRLRTRAEANERRGKYRKAFVRSMRASRRHWQIMLAAGCARVYTLDGAVITLPRKGHL